MLRGGSLTFGTRLVQMDMERSSIRQPGTGWEQEAVIEFFTTGRLLRQWNHTLIVFVPKHAHAPAVRDYRPISSCTVT